MKHYFTIGEIARLFNIGTDSIRYYEKIGVIQPKRGENKYRLYSIKDIWRINVIRDLRSLNFSMEQIKQYLNNRSLASTLELLEEERTAIEVERMNLARQLDNVNQRIAILQGTEQLGEGIVHRESFGIRYCYMIQEWFQVDEEMDVLIQQLLRMYSLRLNIIGNNCIGCRLCGQAVQEGRYNEYDAAFIIDDNGDIPLLGGEYLCISYRGSYKKNALYVPKLLDYAAHYGLQPSGDLLELLLVDIHESSDLTEHMTELQLPVKSI